jgi:hypothetical protein
MARIRRWRGGQVFCRLRTRHAVDQSESRGAGKKETETEREAKSKEGGFVPVQASKLPMTNGRGFKRLWSYVSWCVVAGVRTESQRKKVFFVKQAR